MLKRGEFVFILFIKCSFFLASCPPPPPFFSVLSHSSMCTCCDWMSFSLTGFLFRHSCDSPDSTSHTVKWIQNTLKFLWYNLLSEANANQSISEHWSKKNLNIWTTGICPSLLFHLRFLYKTEDPLSPRNI